MSARGTWPRLRGILGAAAIAAVAFSLGAGLDLAQGAIQAPFRVDESLASLLNRGELILTESNPDGTLKQATAIGRVNAPVDAVWARLVTYEGYPGWMPKVGALEILEAAEGRHVLKWDVEVPGPNYRYTMRSVEDRAARVIQQDQIAGSLGGSHWSWQLVPQGEQTLVYRSAYTNVTDESWVAKQLDDSAHTLSFGVNVTTCLVELRALRAAAER